MSTEYFPRKGHISSLNDIRKYRIAINTSITSIDVQDIYIYWRVIDDKELQIRRMSVETSQIG